MATKISALTAVGSLTGTEQVEVNQSGTSKRTTTQAIADLGGGGSSVGLIARYRNTTGKVLANSTTSIIDFDTADLSNAAVTTGASWHFTAPATAWYDIHFVQAFINSDGNAWVVGSGVRFDVYVNGSTVASISFADAQATTSSIDLWAGGTFAVSLTSGNTLDLRFANASGAQRELESEVAIEIYRVT